ncbi:hypothetical protein F5Y16DRAFT_421235 [Xylariaceae sp. FL0255]|nr:hypothetical protein F5Y16DRAFT_421235 [Xylariaceae sp. FL0255]
MTVPSSRASARKLVRKITEGHGFVSPEELEELETFKPELRRKIEAALLTKDKLIGSSVLTLATNLYTSKARFVFELLQNADDNIYERAKASGDAPYVSFHVHPDRIVVECNEDGFTDKNLAAICAIGKSSKTAAQGYIGEKGIGFKSVFMAASKVHIQSGMLSFSFRHRSGDSGMGMISPVWEETGDTDEVPLPITRLTLHLHEYGDPEQLAQTRQSIKAQFEDLQDTLLLFMKNLQRIHVVSYDDTSQQTSSIVYSIEKPRDTYAILNRSRTTKGVATNSVKRYHITTYEAINLAKNENRTYSVDEEKTKAYAKSQVVLAFPLSESYAPIVEPQDLFVFLPVRPVGYNFLIQADFVTDANRQDVVQDSLRNSQLVHAVAKAFIKAILQFCTHDSLRFQWIKYLPEKGVFRNKRWSGLWLSLVLDIESRLRKTPLFYDRYNNQRRFLTDLVRLTGYVIDDEGNPLFEEDIPGKIVSQQYSDTDLATLTIYGLNWCTPDDILEWVAQDLRRGVSSRIKSPKTPDRWHSKVAQLINECFDKRLNIGAGFRRLGMVPVNNDRWVSCDKTSVYFQTINGLEIPAGIDLKILASKTGDAHRLALFKNLGVKSASFDLVRKSILRFYTMKHEKLELDTSLQHLRFLYSTEDESLDHASYDGIQLLDRSGFVQKPVEEYMYIVNDDSYGASELFKPKPETGAPGYSVSFVHQGYFESPPTRTGYDSWTDWFYNKLQVERYVQFDDPQVLKYIMQYRPEKLLGTLHYLYRREPTQVPRTAVDRNTPIICRGNRTIPLKDTYFPTSDLVARTERFLGHDVFFPWIQLQFDNDSNSIPPTWKSLLQLLGVPTNHTDVGFALGMLQYLIDAFDGEAIVFDAARLFILYDYIQERCWGSDNRTAETQRARIFFSADSYIYIPGPELVWAAPEQCVWDAPQELSTKYVLKKLYGQCFCSHGQECPYFTKFFVETLGVRASCTWQDYVVELEELKEECDDIDTDAITGIYEAIDDVRVTTIDKVALREAFETKALIYASVDDLGLWYKPSQCVWSKSARLRGRISLSEEYEKLERLFTRVLGVRQVDLQMAIDELKDAASQPSSSVLEIKESISTVNSLLVNETNLPSPSAIMETSVFPIRYPSGGVTLGPFKTEFFVVDREQLGESFAPKVKLLDFSLKEVAQLRPVFHWLGLQDRYLSNCVKEVTSFPGQGATLISAPNLQIRHKAHAFLRIACHFNSRRTGPIKELRRLYQALQNAKIFATDDVSSNLQVSQDGQLHQMESSRTTLHIDENESGLHVYIPRKRHDQQYVFTNKLAKGLFEWMVTDPNTRIQDPIEKDGVDATRNILLTSHAKLLEALEDSGLASIDVENTDEVLTEPESETESEPEPEPIPAPPQTPIAISIEGIQNIDLKSVRFTYDGATASNNVGSRRSVRPVSSIGGSLTRSAEPSFEPPTPTRDSITDVHYVVTLSRVIRAGRRDSIAISGESDARRSSTSRLDTVDIGLHSPSQVERNCKVGAAGELYVFELLSHLSGGQGLPEFYRANWKSNIRKYVTVHPEYTDMEDWRGRETSDITYWDVQGALTKELIEKRYLAQNIWEGKRPNYFIEVKTTTGSCDTPFYMRKAQYQRMQGNTNWPDNANGNIYVIFRVYSLGQDNMGLEIYVDPEALRRTDQLKFRSELWSVVPGTN